MSYILVISLIFLKNIRTSKTAYGITISFPFDIIYAYI